MYRLIDLVNKLNKSYVVWQEIFDNGLKVYHHMILLHSFVLSQIKMDTVIDVWKGGWQKEMDAVTKAGYDVILSSCWYLNYISYGEDWKTVSDCIMLATSMYYLLCSIMLVILRNLMVS